MVRSVKLILFLVIGIILMIAGIVFFLNQVQTRQQSMDEGLPQYFETPEFVLTDSFGNSFSHENLRGSVWLVDFIFTRCAGPCPIMTQRMVSIQEKLKSTGLWSKVRLVSISVDPAYDTPEVLKEYAELWKADTSGWHFLTGPEEYTLDLIRSGFKITAQREGSGSMEHGGEDILHSTSFLLVDQSGSVRKIFPLDEPDLPDRVAETAEELLAES